MGTSRSVLRGMELPEVGQEFILTSTRPWGAGQVEVETAACRTTFRDQHRIEYAVTEVLETVNPCPAHRPATGGGVSKLGWKLFVQNGTVHVIES